jgi:hypothetical protein
VKGVVAPWRRPKDYIQGSLQWEPTWTPAEPSSGAGPGSASLPCSGSPAVRERTGSRLLRFVRDRGSLFTGYLFGNPGWCGLDRFAIEIAFDRVENAVDKLGRLTGRETTGNFERLVDGDGLGRCGLEKKFEDGHAEQVTIDDGHAWDAPVFSANPDPLVDLLEILDSPHDKFVGKVANILRRLGQLPPVTVEKILDRRTGDIVGEEHLQCAFTRFTASTHNDLRLASVSFMMNILRGRCGLDHRAEMNRTIISVTWELCTGICFNVYVMVKTSGDLSSTSVNNTLERRGD